MSRWNLEEQTNCWIAFIQPHVTVTPLLVSRVPWCWHRRCLSVLQRRLGKSQGYEVCGGMDLTVLRVRLTLPLDWNLSHGMCWAQAKGCSWGCSGAALCSGKGGSLSALLLLYVSFYSYPIPGHVFCFLRFSAGRCHLISLPCMAVLVVEQLPLLVYLVWECNLERLHWGDSWPK